MVNIGSEMYHIITRDTTKFFIRNDVIMGVDEENDDETVLTQMSDFVMVFKKCKDCSAIGEWFTSKGGKNEL